MNEETDELHTQIMKLVELTEQNKVPWRILNQQTFRWIKQAKQNNEIISTIQYAGKQAVSRGIRQEVIDVYMLTIQSTNPSELLLQVSSQDEAYSIVLKKLFESAKRATTFATANVLKNLLSDL